MVSDRKGERRWRLLPGFALCNLHDSQARAFDVLKCFSDVGKSENLMNFTIQAEAFLTRGFISSNEENIIERIFYLTGNIAVSSTHSLCLWTSMESKFHQLNERERQRPKFMLVIFFVVSFSYHHALLKHNEHDVWSLNINFNKRNKIKNTRQEK